MATETKTETETRPLLFLAEYETAGDVYHAAENVRDAGYEKWDVHTPFPVHGMDKAMGLKDSKVGFATKLQRCSSLRLLVVNSKSIFEQEMYI